MSLTVGLRNILAGGREFAGVWKDFIRVKDKNGIYRVYKEVDGKLQFIGAAKTTVTNNGENVLRVREKFYPAGDNGARNVWVGREYSQNGKKLGSEYQEDIYEISKDLNIRDNDISNVGNLHYRTPGLDEVKSTWIQKNREGIKPFYDNPTPDGYKIGGLETTGSPATSVESRNLTPEELVKYSPWL